MWKSEEKKVLNQFTSFLTAIKTINQTVRDSSLHSRLCICLNTLIYQLKDRCNHPKIQEKQVNKFKKILKFLKNKLAKLVLIIPHRRRRKRSLTNTTLSWKQRCTEVASFKPCLMDYFKAKEINKWFEKKLQNS